MANGGSRCARKYVQKVAEERKAREYDARQEQDAENVQDLVGDSEFRIERKGRLLRLRVFVDKGKQASLRTYRGCVVSFSVDRS